jgi:tetratricopeptide (TPR) repeat protein
LARRAGHAAFGTLASQQALLAEARGDLPAALTAANHAIAIADASEARDICLPSFLLRRSRLLLRLRRLGEARSDAERALAMAQSYVELGTFSRDIGLAQLALGQALQAEARTGGARAAPASAIEHLVASLGADHPDTRLARELAAHTGGTR